LIMGDKISWHVSGEPVVTVTFPILGDVDYKNVKMEKDVVMTGFNGLNQMDVLSFDVTTPEDETHPFFVVDVNLHNPAPVTIDPIGSISMIIKLKGE